METILPAQGIYCRQVRAWPEEAMSALQDCFECTDWAMFKEAVTTNQHTDMEEYAASVSAYIQKCWEDVCVIRNITTRANQIPWMTSEVWSMLRARNAAFKSGDAAALRQARANLNRAIRMAKRTYNQRIQGFFQDPSNTRQCGKESSPSRITKQFLLSVWTTQTSSTSLTNTCLMVQGTE